MDGPVLVVVKKEFASFEDDGHREELIIPDMMSSEADILKQDSGADAAIKIEPAGTPDSMDTNDETENPYICFECGLDCESQSGLIDHFESAHTEECSQESDGNSRRETNETNHDPLAGDVAPDSPNFEKTTKVEGAQNSVPPAEVLLLYSCPCCGHSSTDWASLVKHLVEHVRVTCLSCSNCMYKFCSAYPLKDYSGRDSMDSPHVCDHCPFKTQHYQALKDHCVGHHQSIDSGVGVDHQQISSISGASNDRCSAPPSYYSNLDRNSVPYSTLPSFQGTVSPPNDVIPSIPHQSAQPSFNMLFKTGIISSQRTENVSLPVNNFVSESDVTKSGTVIPQACDQNHRYSYPLNALSSILAIEAFSSRGNHPRSIPKSEPNSVVPEQDRDSQFPVPQLPQKPLSRPIAPKVAVSKLLEEWSVPTVLPESACHETSTEPVVHPNPPVLAGSPPNVTDRCNQLKMKDSRQGVRKKPCPHCSHVARDAHSLKTHILIHTKEKPFACELCSYRATQKAHLQKHMRVHILGNRRGKYSSR